MQGLPVLGHGFAFHVAGHFTARADAFGSCAL
jgi:hypothetical protein